MIQKRDWEQAELQRQFCEAREGSLVCTISPSTRKNPLPASGALFSCPFKEKKKKSKSPNSSLKVWDSLFPSHSHIFLRNQSVSC